MHRPRFFLIRCGNVFAGQAFSSPRPREDPAIVVAVLFVEPLLLRSVTEAHRLTLRFMRGFRLWVPDVFVVLGGVEHCGVFRLFALGNLVGFLDRRPIHARVVVGRALISRRNPSVTVRCFIAGQSRCGVSSLMLRATVQNPISRGQIFTNRRNLPQELGVQGASTRVRRLGIGKV